MKNTVPQQFKDTTAKLAEAGRFNVKPNYTGNKKGGKSYVAAQRRSTKN